MPTDLHSLPTTVQQVVGNYTPSYVPLFSRIFDAGKTVAHEPKIGQIKIETTDVIGDATTRRITSQDTEFKSGKLATSNKVFNKYIRAVKFIKSGWQPEVNINKISAQVLDQNMQAFDINVLTGDPLKDGTLSNNGLMQSKDPNHVTNTSKELASALSLSDAKTFLDGVIKQAEELVGNAPKRIVFTGSLGDKLGGFVPNTAVSVLSAIKDAYTQQGKQLEWLFAPSGAGTKDGVMVVTPSVVTFNYTALPRLYKMGYNDENEYSWFVFIDGSSMVDVEKLGGVIVQPVTFS